MDNEFREIEKFKQWLTEGLVSRGWKRDNSSNYYFLKKQNNDVTAEMFFGHTEDILFELKWGSFRLTKVFLVKDWLERRNSVTLIVECMITEMFHWLARETNRKLMCQCIE